MTKKRFFSSRFPNWKKFAFEFLSIFVAVIAAFALNNWNDNQRDFKSEEKILREVQNGLELDLKDIAVNKRGHQYGIRACEIFRNLLDNRPIIQDSIAFAYTILVRDFTSIMNSSAYEALKSKGLEIINNDSLRFEIISLYDYYYQIIYKLEESATEMQSFENYFMPINEALYPYMDFNAEGNLVRINPPIHLKEDEKKRIFSYLWRIQSNRQYKLSRYEMIEQKIQKLIQNIDKELET